MRNFSKVAIVLVACLALGECFVAWPKHDNKISTRRKEYGDYFSSILDTPPRAVGDTPASSQKICLYVSPDLPQCDFDRMDNLADTKEDSRVDYQHIYDRPSGSSGDQSAKSANVASGSDHPAVEIERNIVYSIEGCLPTKLPFDIPACKDEDYADGLFEVRKLYPFRVKASTSKETFVFPEFNFGQWLKMMRRFDEQQSLPSASGAEEVGVKAGEARTEVAERGGEPGRKEADEDRHLQSVLMSATKRKTTMPRAKIASRYVSKGSPLSSFIVHRGDSETVKKERHERVTAGNIVDDDLVLLEFRPIVNSFYAAKMNQDGFWREEISPVAKGERNWSFETPLNDLGADGQIDSLPAAFREARVASRSRREVIRKGSEFPYAKAIPFDPKKLGQHPRKNRQITRVDSARLEPARRYKPQTMAAHHGKYPKV